MTRILLVLLLLGCKKAEPPTPHREPEPILAPTPRAVLEKANGDLIQYKAQGSEESVEDRAYGLVKEMAEKDGFSRRFVNCKPWVGGGHICDLCYNSTKNLYGQNRVWCGAEFCETVTRNDDIRQEGIDWNLCLKP